jgi:hypothetical protein
LKIKIASKYFIILKGVNRVIEIEGHLLRWDEISKAGKGHESKPQVIEKDICEKIRKEFSLVE